MKRLKNMFLICRRNTVTSIGKTQTGGRRVVLRVESIAGDRQLAAVRHCVERVLNDVIHHLRQTVSISFDDDAVRGCAGCDHYACARGQISEESSAARNEFAKINRGFFESLLTSEFKQPAHECIQAFYLRGDHTKSLAQLLRSIRRAPSQLDVELDRRQRIAAFVRHTRDDTTKSRGPL